MELDIEQPDALIAYLRGADRIASGESPIIRVLRGGVSNRTVLVQRPSGEAWVLKQALAKLRVSVDWFCDPARINREALGLHWLARLAPKGATTPLIFLDPGVNLLAMTAVPEPHQNWKTMLLAGRIDRDHIRQFGELLGTVHREAAESREPLREIFQDRGFFQTLRIEPYYEYSAGQVPQARAFLDDLIAATREVGTTLVHGDYSPKNILIHEDRLVLLDHEVIHWGDPGFDVGFAMTHLLSKAHHLSTRRAPLRDAADLFWKTYAASVGPPLWNPSSDSMAVRHTLGCLLARVAGRSTLEYLTQDQRARQREAVIQLMHTLPPTMAELIDSFTERVNAAN